MRLVTKICSIIALLYCLFWAVLAVYFSYIDWHKGAFEEYLGRYFKASVKIDSLETSWNGISPYVVVSGLKVEGDQVDQVAFAFSSLQAQLDPWSIIKFWPKFTEFSVSNPVVDIEILSSNRIKIAGLELGSGRASLFSPKKALSWFLDQENMAWSNGQVILRRPNADQQDFGGISFTFDREYEDRHVRAEFASDAGDILAFKMHLQGDLLASADWGASLEVVDDADQSLLRSESFILKVESGEGALKLKTLSLQSIRDIIQLTGLSQYAQWLYTADITGRLHDMELDFSGPLFDIDDWELKASASAVGFKTTGMVPAMNNLAGQVTVSQGKGQFLFSTQEATFEWGLWFDSPFDIKKASGDFGWKISVNGDVEIALRDGQFQDKNCSLSNINATARLNQKTREIKNLADWFKVESVAELNYENSKVIEPNVGSLLPLDIDFSADFQFNDMGILGGYLPKRDNLSLFRQWWDKAFLSGAVSNGKVTFQGVPTLDALYSGESTLKVDADFDNVAIDYGYQQSWPKISKSRGVLMLRNDLLTIRSNDSYLGRDKVDQVNVSIDSLFKPNLKLSINGKLTQSLDSVMEFIFKGPLIAKNKRPAVAPLRAEQGLVDLELFIVVPLKNVRETTVQGLATIKNGTVYLPGRVPVTKLSSTVRFTERSVTADKITAQFLGGKTQATLKTVKPAQPPVMKITASGNGLMAALKPWLGEHVLTLVSGVAPWQGSVVIDGGAINIDGQSNLFGVQVDAPAPLQKGSEEKRNMSFSMKLGNQRPAVSLRYSDVMALDMQAEANDGSLFERSLIRVGGDSITGATPYLAQGVNFDFQQDNINLDDWLNTIIQLAQYESSSNSETDRSFLDAMRSIKIQAQSPVMLSRDFGALDMSLLSLNGVYWIAKINGENASGTMQLEPSKNIYAFDMTHLNLGPEIDRGSAPTPIDYSLTPDTYPNLSLFVKDFQVDSKKFGRLAFIGKAGVDAWTISTFEMERNGLKTTGKGGWVNSVAQGSMTSFDFQTEIGQAEHAMGDFSLDGFIKKGSGSMSANINWVGAPHEFDYSRLNGEFDLRINDGELVKVEPGGGKLLGLLNFNAVARRLTLDFRDVFATGLTFDRMLYTGLLADGKILMREAYIFTPAVFVRMEGQIDLSKETIDMEVHMSPELGGNIALLSALANPAAGAVVFITQRLFKEQLRDSSFTSYRALGTWEDFEVEQFDSSKIQAQKKSDDSVLSDVPEQN